MAYFILINVLPFLFHGLRLYSFLNSSISFRSFGFYSTHSHNKTVNTRAGPEK